MSHSFWRSADRSLPALAVLLSVWAAPVPTAHAATALPPPPEVVAGVPALFGAVEGLAARDAASGIGVVRGRAVSIRFDTLRPLRPGSDRLDLNLFDDARLTGLVDRVESHAIGAVSYSGRLAEDPHGSFSLVAQGDAVAGVIRTEHGGLYEIGTLEGDVHYVHQVAPDALPPCGNTPGRIVPPESLTPTYSPAAEPSGGGAAEANVDIDVLIVYTAAAMNISGGKAAIEAKAQLAIDQGNVAYTNSGIYATLRLVHVAPVTYTESTGATGFDAALDALTFTNDGKMDNVHALRDQYGADVVSLLVSNTAYCGLGWVMNSLQYSFATYGFNVVSYKCTGGTTLVHEIGHNQGSHHDRQNATDTSGNVMASVYPYSYGWRFNGDNGVQYRTVMAYSPGTQIPYFSNPNVLYRNRPTGVPAGMANASDNVQSINNTRAVVAAWRGSADKPEMEMVGSVLSAEECLPANGAPDPGEKITLAVSFRNIGGLSGANVVATLEAGGGVEPITITQSYGALAGGGAPVSRPFQLRAYGECGGTATVTLRLTDGGQSLGTFSIPLRLGALSGASTVRAVYSSEGLSLAIPGGGVVEQRLYVADVGLVSDVNVSVRLNHTYDGNLTLSLLSPDGTEVVLSSANGGAGDNYGGGTNSCYGFFTVFDDSAANLISASTVSKPPFIGSYRPEESLSAFTGKETKGYWTLRIGALTSSNTGSLGCWKLDMARQTFQCCAAPFTIRDAVDALRISGGQAASQTSQMSRLNVRTASPSTNRIDITDAVSIARKATGLEK